MQSSYFEGRTLVTGRAVSGTLTTDSLSPEPGSVLLTRRLLPGDYPGIRRAAAVVCEQGGSTDHASVIARILGKPIVQIPCALELLHPGDLVTISPAEQRVYLGRQSISCRLERLSAAGSVHSRVGLGAF